MLVKADKDSTVWQALRREGGQEYTFQKSEIKSKPKISQGQVRERTNHFYSFTGTGNLDPDTNILYVLRMQIKQKHDTLYW